MFLQFQTLIVPACARAGLNSRTKKRGLINGEGDLFEIFAEIFFKLTSSAPNVGVTDYTPVSSVDDNGVDGKGINIFNDVCTIQVKFRSNPKNTLTINDIKNFQGLSYTKYNVSTEGRNLIFFTNCIGIHWNTETNVMNNKTITYSCYDKKSDYSLNKLLDNNLSFWKNVKKIIKENKYQLN